MPLDILHPVFIWFTCKETFTAQIGMLLTKRDHTSEEPEHTSVLLFQLPIEPTDLVILAVRIIISLLCTSYFISG